jgi:hypothetical protein
MLDQSDYVRVLSVTLPGSFRNSQLLAAETARGGTTPRAPGARNEEKREAVICTKAEQKGEESETTVRRRCDTMKERGARGIMYSVRRGNRVCTHARRERG